ncbi:hypothetical protein ACWJW2_19825, partial [Clostridioides difficile]
MAVATPRRAAPAPPYPPPRFEKIPERDGSLGAAATVVAHSVGLSLDGHQQHAFDVGMSYRHVEESETHLVLPGRPRTWAATQFGFIEPRQNGKSRSLLARQVVGILLLNEPHIIHSAHEVKTAMESFYSLKNLTTDYDILRKRVKRIHSTNGREGIEFYGSGKARITRTTRVSFMARTKGSGRGFSASTILLDEAQELGFAVLAAILPTLSAIPNSQMWMCGTPPSPEMNGEVITRQRLQAKAGSSPRQAWVEWGAGPEPGQESSYDYSDPRHWVAANPACPSRIPLSAIEDEFAAMDEETFRRDRLGEWDEEGIDAIIPASIWNRQADPDAGFYDGLSLCVDVNPARTHSSITLAGYTDKSHRKRHMQLLARGAGTDWVVKFVKDFVHDPENKTRAVMMDALSPAASLAGALKANKVQVTLLNTRDVAMACGQMYDGIVAGSVTHADQDELSAAMRASKKREVSDSWVLNRKK